MKFDAWKINIYLLYNTELKEMLAIHRKFLYGGFNIVMQSRVLKEFVLMIRI